MENWFYTIEFSQYSRCIKNYLQTNIHSNASQFSKEKRDQQGLYLRNIDVGIIRQNVYIIMWRDGTLSNPMCFCNTYVYQMNTLYTLSLHNSICQLPLSKAERKLRKKKKPWKKKPDCALVIIIMHYKVKKIYLKWIETFSGKTEGKTKL